MTAEAEAEAEAVAVAVAVAVVVDSQGNWSKVITPITTHSKSNKDS